MATTPSPSPVKPGPAAAPAATLPAPDTTTTGPAVEPDTLVAADNATVGQNPADIPDDPTLTDTVKDTGPATADQAEERADILVADHDLETVAKLLLAKAADLGHDIERDVQVIAGGFRVRKSLAEHVAADLPHADN